MNKINNMKRLNKKMYLRMIKVKSLSKHTSYINYDIFLNLELN